MKVGEITCGSSEHEQALDLRNRILREPLGVTWTAEERAAEKIDRHFGLFDESGLIACVVVKDLGNATVKIRQMAVEPDQQGSGVGRALMEGVEVQLREDGVERVELNARDTAVGFYEKLGYGKVGEEFYEVTIPHWKMVKAVGL